MTVMDTYAPGTFCWADLGTPDAAAAKRFYTSLFEWSFEDRPIGTDAAYTMFSVNGKAVAALYQAPSNPGIPPHWLSYISVESADETVTLALNLGGTIIDEAFDVFDVGRMAVIQDPTGGVVALWEPKRHIGAGIVGEANTLCWNELATTDTAAAAGFYQSLLGWRAQTEQMGSIPYTLFRRGDSSAAGMMQIGAGSGPMPPHWLVYFAVDDCDACARRARSLGAAVRAEPFDIEGVGRVAALEDPQGAGFAVIRLAGM